MMPTLNSDEQTTNIAKNVSQSIPSKRDSQYIFEQINEENEGLDANPPYTLKQVNSHGIDTALCGNDFETLNQWNKNQS